MEPVPTAAEDQFQIQCTSAVSYYAYQTQPQRYYEPAVRLF